MASPPPPDSDLFPIRYSLQGGAPRVDITLDVSADGSFLVEALTEPSLPQTHPVRLGQFAGRLPADVLESLVEWAGGPGAGSGGAGPVAQGTVARLAGVGGGDSVPVESPPGGLEDALAARAVEALSNPVAAVEVGANVANNQLVIRGLGQEALPILLFDRDDPGYWVRVWRDDASAPGGQVYLPYETIEDLVNRGEFAEGPVALPPGDSVSIPLPPAAPPADETATSSGGFIFWRRGDGPERRIVTGTW